MAKQLPMQDYVFASEIAYKDNPLADLKATKYTLQDFANAAQGFIVKLRWLHRQSVDPTQRLIIFSLRQVKRGKHLMVEVMTAYGNTMIEMGP
jgi:hypothetical protein